MSELTHFEVTLHERLRRIYALEASKILGVDVDIYSNSISIDESGYGVFNLAGEVFRIRYVGSDSSTPDGYALYHISDKYYTLGSRQVDSLADVFATIAQHRVQEKFDKEE